MQKSSIPPQKQKTGGYRNDHLLSRKGPSTRLLELYLQSCEWKGLSARTVRIYRDKIGAFLSLLPDPTKSPTPDDVLAFLGAMRKRGWNAGGISIHFRSLKSYFRWAVRQGLLKKNPLEDLPSLARTRPPLVETLNPSAIQRLFSAACRLDRNRARNVAILHLLLDCALRPGELRSLQCRDVNMELNTITVEGKTGQRQLPFSFPTRKSLLAWLRTRPNVPGEDSLFLQRGGEPLTKAGLRSILRHLKIEAKLTGRIYPYLLRHSSATAFLRAGASMESVRQLLGHSTYAMTQRYLSLNHADLAKAQKKYSPVQGLHG